MLTNTLILTNAAQPGAVVSADWGLTAAVLLGAAVLGYLLGSLEFGIIVSKGIFHDDVRTHGSGNAGMTNVLRTFGKKAAALVLVGDMGKGVAAVLIARAVSQTIFGTAYPNGIDIGSLAAFCAVIGHLKPIFFGFKGGKGVAVAAGTILVTNPPVFLCLLVLFLAVVGVSRIVSLSSISCAVGYPVCTLIFCLITGHNALVNTCFAAVMGGLVIWMHRENIQRLRNGTEYKFGQNKKKQ